MAESLSELRVPGSCRAPRVRDLRYSGPESYDTLPPKALLQCPRPVQELRVTAVAQCWAVGLDAQAISLQSEHLETQVSGFYTLEFYTSQALSCSLWAAVPGLWARTANTGDCLLACWCGMGQKDSSQLNSYDMRPTCAVLSEEVRGGSGLGNKVVSSGCLKSHEAEPVGWGA